MSTTSSFKNISTSITSLTHFGLKWVIQHLQKIINLYGLFMESSEKWADFERKETFHIEVPFSFIFVKWVFGIDLSYTQNYTTVYTVNKKEFYSDEKCSFYDTNRTINRNRHLHSDSDATKIGDSTCFVYTREPRCDFYCNVYKSMDGYLRRSWVVVWILYFRGVPTRHRFPRAIAYSLCDTRSLFPTEISKDVRKPQILMDF